MTVLVDSLGVAALRRGSALEGSWGRGDWMKYGLCRQVDAEMFYPPDSDDALGHNGAECNDAKKLCGLCPVRELCLEYALRSPRREHGVWGGTTENERRVMRRQYFPDEEFDGDEEEEEDWVELARARVLDLQEEV